MVEYIFVFAVVILLILSVYYFFNSVYHFFCMTQNMNRNTKAKKDFLLNRTPLLLFLENSYNEEGREHLKKFKLALGMSSISAFVMYILVQFE